MPQGSSPSPPLLVETGTQRHTQIRLQQFARINCRIKDTPGLSCVPELPGSVPACTGQQGRLCEQALTPGPPPFPNSFPKGRALQGGTAAKDTRIPSLFYVSLS